MNTTNTADSVAAALKKLQIMSRSVRLIARADGRNSDWDKGASHWQVCLYRVGVGKPAEVVVTYSMGSAHKGAPKTADVLHSLLLDSSAADESFDDWCGNYGYDTDSRSALATYDACCAIAKDLARLFTPSELRELREAFADY